MTVSDSNTMEAHLKKTQSTTKRAANVKFRRSSLQMLEESSDTMNHALGMQEDDLNKGGHVNLDNMSNRLSSALKPLEYMNQLELASSRIYNFQSASAPMLSVDRDGLGVTSGGSFNQSTAGSYIRRIKNIDHVYGDLDEASTSAAIAARPRTQLLKALDNSGWDKEIKEEEEAYRQTQADGASEANSTPKIQKPKRLHGAQKGCGSVAVELRKAGTKGGPTSAGAQQRAAIMKKRADQAAKVALVGGADDGKMLLQLQHRTEREAWKFMKEYLHKRQEHLKLNGDDAKAWDAYNRMLKADKYHTLDSAIRAFLNLKLRPKLPLPESYSREVPLLDFEKMVAAPDAATIAERAGAEYMAAFAQPTGGEVGMGMGMGTGMGGAGGWQRKADYTARQFVLLADEEWVEDREERGDELHGGVDVHGAGFTPLAKEEMNASNLCSGASYIGHIYSFLDHERNRHRPVSTAFCRALNFDNELLYMPPTSALLSSSLPRPGGGCSSGGGGGGTDGRVRSSRFNGLLACLSMANAGGEASGRYNCLTHLKLGAGTEAGTLVHLSVALRLGAMRKLRHLHLLLPHDLGGDQMRHLSRALSCAHCNKLKELSLGGSRAGDDIMAVLCNTGLASKTALPSLQVLDLAAFAGRYRGAMQLGAALLAGGLHHVRRLDLSTNSMEDGIRGVCKGLSAPRSGLHLRHLNLANNGFTALHVGRLCKMLVTNALPKLQELDLSNNLKIGDIGGIELAKAFRKLAALSLANKTKVDEEDGKTDSSRGGAGAEADESFFQLTVLRLAGNALSDASIQPLVECFADSHFGLRELDFSSNRVSEDCVRTLSDVSSKGGLQKLTHLDLSHNRLAQEGIEVLLNIPTLTESIISLNVTCNSAGLTGLTSIASATQGIGAWPRLRCLRLGKNLLPGESLEDVKKNFELGDKESGAPSLRERGVTVEFGKRTDMQNEVLHAGNDDAGGVGLDSDSDDG